MARDGERKSVRRMFQSSTDLLNRCVDIRVFLFELIYFSFFLTNNSSSLNIWQLMYNAGVDTDLSNLYKIGDITELIPEAADASVTGATVEDGKSGDTDFPFGDLKVLATVGEVGTCGVSEGEMVVGVPDGLGAYLFDNKTVRVIVQSEVRTYTVVIICDSFNFKNTNPYRPQYFHIVLWSAQI